MRGFSDVQVAFSFDSPAFAAPDVLAFLGEGAAAGSAWDAHDLCTAGLPGAALEHLVAAVPLLHVPANFEAALGISIRTYQRRRDEPEKILSPEQSGRIWKFAEILVKAISALGDQDSAEAWMLRPAMGLNGRRPIDLLGSPSGTGLLEDFLGRLEYGVYT